MSFVVVVLFSLRKGNDFGVRVKLNNEKRVITINKQIMIMKVTRIATMLMFMLLMAMASNIRAEGEIERALKQSVEYKVEKYKGIIGFSDEKAEYVKEIELKYLMGIYNVEKRAVFNKSKKIKQIKAQRDYSLQKILERDEYIKYNSLDNELFMNVPVHLE